MKIEYLNNCPKHVETVAAWIYDEFVDKSKSKFTLEKAIDYYGQVNIDKLPITLIAIKNDNCVGTISLYENDLKTQKELTPWLASLYVDKDYRGQGIAQALINGVIKVTRDLGYKTLYLRTEHTAEYYRKRGWEFLYNTTDEHDQETDVFKYDISK